MRSSLIFALLCVVNTYALSGIWSGLDYRGLRVRNWNDGLAEAGRREMPMMVIFMKSNVIDQGTHKLLGFSSDSDYLKRSERFVVIVADDTDPIFNETFTPESGLNSTDLPKFVFYHFNGLRIKYKGEPADLNYSDSFELTDAMESVLDLFEAGYVPTPEDIKNDNNDVKNDKKNEL